jgi:hypothetical protein
MVAMLDMSVERWRIGRGCIRTGWFSDDLLYENPYQRNGRSPVSTLCFGLDISGRSVQL